jgi:hypothetical protein
MDGWIDRWMDGIALLMDGYSDRLALLLDGWIF